MTQEQRNNLIEALRNIRRYDVSVCDCCLGPHVEQEEESDGTYVRFEDLENLLNNFS